MNPSVAHLTRQFYEKLGYRPNLDDPGTIQEKMLWRKLHEDMTEAVHLTDKVAVRDYVRAVAGEQYLVEALAIVENAEDLDFDSLPCPCILKVNNGSGANVIVRDRSKLDVPAVKRVLNYGLRLPHGRRLGEHWYAAIEPRIIVEPLLQDRIYDIPTEYMFHVFHGRAAFVQVASSKAYSETPTSKWVGPTAGLQFIDRSQARFTWYGLDWQPAPFQNQGHIPSVSVLPGKPVNADEMICVAEKLAGDWGYVRVDFRCVDETQLYFGEMTFSHASGYSPVVPHDYNRVLGDLWDIRGRYVRAR